MAFILTQENAFSYRFHFIPGRKSLGSPKSIGYRNFQNSLPLERSTYFYVAITGNFERCQCFNSETNFQKNEKLFKETGVPFFS